VATYSGFWACSGAQLGAQQELEVMS
jgi:hypothetical protein